MPRPTPSNAPSPIKVCAFDAYGTLFDLHSAVARNAALLGETAQAFSALWRIKQLEYSWIRSAMPPPSDGWRDFWRLTEDALDFSMRSFKVEDDAIRRKLLEAYMTLDAFPEVPAVLGKLKKQGMPLAILSNGEKGMLQSAIASAGLKDTIDLVCSVDEVEVFKPNPNVYAMITRTLSVEPGEVAFFSSNAWDAAGASSYGFQVIWVNRSGQPREYPFASVVAEVADLTPVPDLIAARGVSA